MPPRSPQLTIGALIAPIALAALGGVAGGAPPTTSPAAAPAAIAPAAAPAAIAPAAPAAPAAIAPDAAIAPAAPAEAAPVPAAPDPGETIVIDDRVPSPAPGRAVTVVTRADLDERLPRSAPDALRWEPGVYVQQTSAAQGSAYLRGRTGQQTVLLFDGVRLNNATWRQGPNQYFFTIDTRTLAAIDVMRGSASTRWGSDAIGGVLDAVPRDPDPGPRRLAPRLELRWGSADHELGGRLELASRPWRGATLATGVGYRDVSLLESGGQVVGVDGAPALVPSHLEDGRTQRGTSFREAAWDARLIQRLDDELRLTAAYYDYRQLDAPRTDQCPAAFAPRDECLRFDEQFHTLVYAAVDAHLGGWADRARVVVSAQEQHERRTRDRPRAAARDGGRDDTRSLGLAAAATTRALIAGPVAITLEYGADAYLDTVDSVAWLEFTDIDFVRFDSRGQYLSGSRYATGGGFAMAAAAWGPWTLRGGARLGAVVAHAPGDPASATQAIDQTWLTDAAFASLAWQPLAPLTLAATLDRSFRAPNLDDLTGRQATGPGFQFENAALAPERATTAELGVRFDGPIGAEAWAYASRVDGAIARSLRALADCPPTAADCRGAWFRYQLVNLDGPATVVGVELAASARWRALHARATLAWARGDGPTAGERPRDPTVPFDDTEPLSRVPPLAGTAELRRSWSRAYLAAGLRWAASQTRLAASDRGDPRIPTGGTRGYAVVDLRAGLRVTTAVRVTAVAENLLDAAYRYHGSSIDGAGRSLLLVLEMTP